LDEPFVLHNVDVVSTIDLHRMVQFHKENRALATLAVQSRESSRQLLFDDERQLCGRRIGKDSVPEIARPSPQLHPFAFSGIHIISPRLLSQIQQEGIFSIIDTYLDLAAKNQKIMAFRTDQYYWRDLGRQSDLAQAAEDLKRNLFS
jgi:NDP-sugar pyrophosphorylase family protein